ncbi:MAG: hypothetical protein HRT89_01455 [Lentisphaeria bacterium]|nr:hypothetical protein [Lentisphaeria bacterium]NQZ66712.1 hypothetical protein [Lentisphaeria bacterium]
MPELIETIRESYKNPDCQNHWIVYEGDGEVVNIETLPDEEVEDYYSFISAEDPQ